MPVVSPERYHRKKQRKSKRVLFLLPIFVLLAAGTGNFLRPLPKPTTSFSYKLPSASTTVNLTWPAQGQAAVAANGYGLLATYGDQQPIATASITKVILALCVLQKLPITDGAGATFTVSQADVDLYQHYIDAQGSRVPVTAGEQLTEYQAIQALLLPSANNIADSLVNWVFGGHDQYVAYATEYLQKHDMFATKIGTDASGYDASTVSTASDLSRLGLMALQNPVIMQIAGQASAPFPVAGTVYNYNSVLGQGGITGLKTGNNDANPGAFLFTATAQYGAKNVEFTGAVLGAQSLDSALAMSVALVESMQKQFETIRVSQASDNVGSLRTAWGTTIPIKTSQTLDLIRWKGSPLRESHQLNPSVSTGVIGSLKVSADEMHTKTNLVLASPVGEPSFWWRLTRF